MRGRLASRRRAVASLFATAAVTALAVTALAMPASAGPGAGYKTSQAAMLDPVLPGTTVEPLITVGETLPGTTYKFESIPDGIALRKGHGNTVEAYVNHETSTVPFPLAPVRLNDFTNSMVSKLTFNRQSTGILSGSYVIPSEANYQRFCSNFIADHQHGFERPLLLTNEEATDFVNRTGNAFPGTPGEQAGVVVAYDLETGAYKTIYGMGRHNHENSVALEGYGHPVVLSGDDTFSAPASQMYMYLAGSADDVWNDRGSLWAFQSDEANDYGDLSGSQSISGRFIPVPRNIAVGDQAGLESWSNTNNVFQFIRVEDIAYDRKDKNVVYFADTGEPRAKRHPTSGRLFRDSTGGGPFPNGRMFKMVLNREDPTVVESLSILVDGDARGAAGAGALDLIHQPDNVETTRDLLLWQEDPGSQNNYALGTGTTARIWAMNLKSGGEPFVVARVNQSADEGPTDVDSDLDPAPGRQDIGRAGAWESSGIVDASKFFGKGAFLVDIQAPTLVVEEQVRSDATYQREGGQLLLLRLPWPDEQND